MSAPTPSVGAPLHLETLMDAVAYVLATDSRTQKIEWILGDVGMGRPSAVPFGYISILNEQQLWYTANGGQGGLSTGGPNGLDDWTMPIVLTVAFAKHRYVPPTPAIPPTDSPFSAPNNSGFAPPYKEQPGWRQALQINAEIKKVIRTNPVMLGAATDTRVVESRYLLQEMNNEIFRVARSTVQTQQRRVRGN